MTATVPSADLTASSSRSLFGRFASLMGGRVVGAAAMFFASLVIARGFGPERLAEFALVVSAIGVLSVVLGAGFHRIGAIYTAKFTARAEPQFVGAFMGTAFRHILVGGSLIAATAVAIALTGWRPLPGLGPTEALLILAGAAGTAVLYLLSSVMVGMRRQVRAILPDALIRPSLFLVTLIVLVVLWRGAPLAMIGLAYVVTIWLAVAAVLVLSRSQWRALFAQPAATPRREWRRAAYPWAVISLSWDYLIDVLILVAGIVGSQYEVAVLYVCFRFSVFAAFGLRSILSLFLPDLSGAEATGDRGELGQRLMQVDAASVAFVVIVIAAFAVAGPILLGLFGETMRAGHGALIVVAIGLVPPAIFGPAPQLLTMRGHHTVSATVMAAGMVFAIAATWVLLPALGVIGAAIAFATANFFVYAALWRITLTRTGIDGSLFAALRRVDGESGQAPG